jgi:hypothetical protein
MVAEKNNWLSTITGVIYLQYLLLYSARRKAFTVLGVLARREEKALCMHYIWGYLLLPLSVERHIGSSLVLRVICCRIIFGQKIRVTDYYSYGILAPVTTCTVFLRII